MEKHDKLALLENTNRPGPNFYDDCVKFNWVTALVKSHKKHIEGKGENYEYYMLTEEDLKW
jgi:hypothetical protein